LCRVLLIVKDLLALIHRSIWYIWLKFFFFELNFDRQFVFFWIWSRLGLQFVFKITISLTKSFINQFLQIVWITAFSSKMQEIISVGSMTFFFLAEMQKECSEYAPYQRLSCIYLFLQLILSVPLACKMFWKCWY